MRLTKLRSLWIVQGLWMILLSGCVHEGLESSEDDFVGRVLVKPTGEVNVVIQRGEFISDILRSGACTSIEATGEESEKSSFSCPDVYKALVKLDQKSGTGSLSFESPESNAEYSSVGSDPVSNDRIHLQCKSLDEGNPSSVDFVCL
jgi:hypothetical protein